MTTLDIDLSASTEEQLEVYRGDNREFECTLTEGGVAVNITGDLIAFTVKEKFEDTTALIHKNVGGGITITNGAAGEFTILLRPSDTASLFGQYIYDIRWKSIPIEQRTIACSTFTVLKQVE